MTLWLLLALHPGRELDRGQVEQSDPREDNKAQRLEWPPSVQGPGKFWEEAGVRRTGRKEPSSTGLGRAVEGEMKSESISGIISRIDPVACVQDPLLGDSYSHSLWRTGTCSNETLGSARWCVAGALSPVVAEGDQECLSTPSDASRVQPREQHAPWSSSPPKHSAVSRASQGGGGESTGAGAASLRSQAS